MTKEEIKEVMKEMECWSCDNHLNICDKHTCRDNEAKECKHEDKDACIEPCNHDEVCGKCGKCFPDTPTPPSKVDPCKDCGAKKPKFCTCKQPPRVSQTTRLEKIQAQHNNGVYHPESMSYLLSKLVTAVEVLEEIAHSLDGNYEEGWMANEVAAEATKSIN